MKKLLSATMILSLVVLASCAQFESMKDAFVSKAKVSASKSITTVIVKEGQCANVEAVKLDVDKLLKVESDESVVVKAIAEAEEAPAAPQFTGSSTKLVSKLCKSAFSLAVPALLAKGVPEAWGCSLTDLNAKIDVLAAKACDKI